MRAESMVKRVDGPKKENWKKIKGYEGYYSISNLGRIRREIGAQGTQKGRILKSCKTSFGYLTTALSKKSCRETVLIHILLASHFIGKRPKGMVINHKDQNPSNNALRNLEYTTYSNNIKQAYIRGNKKHKSVLTAEQVIEIRNNRKRKGNKGIQVQLAKKFKVSSSYISMIANQKRRKYI